MSVSETHCGGFLRHQLLTERSLPHGFGTRGATPPSGWAHPQQIHGNGVVVLAAPPSRRVGAVGRADAVVSCVPGLAVGVVTADCVPILVAHEAGVVAAIHAGWRGLARGVVGAALQAVGDIAVELDNAVAVVGPHIGPEHYEIDAPVYDALAARFGRDLESALAPSRPAHWRLDLGALTHRALLRGGLSDRRIGHLPAACTYADAGRFHSRRRDGAGAGRLVHFIALPAPAAAGESGGGAPRDANLPCHGSRDRS